MGGDGEKRKEELEKQAAEISRRKVERSWAAQEEYRKGQEAGNAAAESSKTVEEPPCWNCTEREQECIWEG